MSVQANLNLTHHCFTVSRTRVKKTVSENLIFFICNICSDFNAKMLPLLKAINELSEEPRRKLAKRQFELIASDSANGMASSNSAKIPYLLERCDSVALNHSIRYAKELELLQDSPSSTSNLADLSQLQAKLANHDYDHDCEELNPNVYSSSDPSEMISIDNLNRTSPSSEGMISFDTLFST
jgi:hypothetical protein